MLLEKIEFALLLTSGDPNDPVLRKSLAVLTGLNPCSELPCLMSATVMKVRLPPAWSTVIGRTAPVVTLTTGSTLTICLVTGSMNRLLTITLRVMNVAFAVRNG
jgi:hypothetical protein